MLQVIQELISIFNALLTPTIASITTYIAIQQWKANKQKLRMEIYDRRLRIYKAIKEILQLVLRDANVKKIQDLYGLIEATAEADFLFDEDIQNYINEIYSRGIKLHYANKQYCDYTQVPPVGYDHNAVINEMHTQMLWFADQLPIALTMFKKYLNISR